MNKKVIEQLAGTLKLDAKLLAKSLESDTDSTLELPKVFFDTDITTIKENFGKEKYDEGAKVSREKTMKELSDLAGFEERVKDKEGFIKAFKEKIVSDSSIEPNKKVEELNSSVAKLQGLILDEQNKYTDLKGSYELKEKRFKVSSIIPDVSEKAGLSKDEATSLFFLSHEIKEDGIYKNGEKLKGDVENTLSLEDSVKLFVSEKSWDLEPAPRGRGGNPKPDSVDTPTTLDEFETLAKSKNYSVGSREYNSLLAEAVKENPEIIG